MLGGEFAVSMVTSIQDSTADFPRAAFSIVSSEPSGSEYACEMLWEVIDAETLDVPEVEDLADEQDEQ